MKRPLWHLLILGLTFVLPAQAQSNSNQAIQLVIPYSPGGGADILARALAERLGPRLGQHVIPDNKPGAATMLASSQVARATPNGQTLLIGTLAHSLNAVLQPKLAYDPVNDFEFIGKVGDFGFLLVTTPKQEIKDLRDLIAKMKEQPGKLQFGSAGIGSPMHLGGEYLKYLTKTDAVHVPYKGEGAALADLLGGHINFMLCTVSTCAARVQDGSLKALAAPSPARAPQVPNVPTSAEAGLPGYEIYTWVFLAAPKGTPAPAIEKLDRALNEVLADEEFRSKATALGIQVNARSSPAATKQLVQSEITKWGPVIKASGMTPN